MTGYHAWLAAKVEAALRRAEQRTGYRPPRYAEQHKEPKLRMAVPEPLPQPDDEAELKRQRKEFEF